MLTISIILLMCCKSTAKKDIKPFPNPVLNGENVIKYDDATKTVSMPLWYWLSITDYVIEIEENLN